MGAMANKAARAKAELLAENEQLRLRLDEAEQTLDAIRSGDVDALVVAGPEGDRVFSLTGAERTYRLIVETMNEAAVTVDLSGGILFCNQRFSELMRCPLSKALGRKITDFVALAQKQPMQKFLASAQAGPVQRSLTLRAADGVAVSVQLAASPLLDAGNTCICLVASDLTELEAQADSIRLMHEHQQALEESGAELQAANAALSQSRLAALNASKDAIAAQRQAEELTVHLQREIAERKQVEVALKKSEALYRGIGESIDYGVWVCTAEGRNTYASESFLKMVGLTQEQFSNYGWVEVLHPDDAERTVAAWQECVRTGGKWDIEFRFRGIDGQWHHVLARGVPIRDEEGGVSNWVGINLDITDRKEAERARRLSEERYQLLFNKLLEGFCIIEVLFDSDSRPIDYRFLSINPAFETQTGLRNALGKRIRELVPDNETYWFDLYGQVALTGIPARFVNEVKALNRWYDVSAYRVGDEEDRTVAILFNDITEAKQAELALRASQERLALATNCGQIGLFDWDVPSGVLQWTEQHEIIFGYSPTTTTTTTTTTTSGIVSTIHNFQRWADRLHPEDLPRVEEEARRCQRGRKPFEMRYRIVWPDGSLHWVETKGVYFYGDDGMASRMLGMVMDITAQQLAEEALKDSEERYRLLAETMLQGVVHQDVNGRIISMNPAAARILGKSQEQLLGSSSIQVEHDCIRENGDPFPGDEHPAMVSLRTGQPLHGIIMGVFNPKLKEYRWISIDAVPVFRSGETTPSEVYTMFDDVTERKQAEELLQASLREKEVLLKEIHHRVKNNMQVISSLVSLQADALNNPELTGIFEDIRDRVRSMALVHEKLYSSDNLLTVDFAEYATGLLNYLWRAHKDSADTITLALDLKQVLLSVDFAIPCGLILNELAINALKHAFKGRSHGEITVAISSAPDAVVRMTVSDNGVGMPDGLDWRHANSLGLNLVRMLSKQLKAQVEVRSNNGTVFRITFNARSVKSQQKGAS